MHYRWVHNNDIVTRVPPVFMGYRHCGDEIYFDRYGRIKKLTGIWRARDRWRGLLRGLLKWRIDLLTDHSIRQYAEHLMEAVNKENLSLATHHGETSAESIAIHAVPEAEKCERTAAQ